LLVCGLLLGGLVSAVAASPARQAGPAPSADQEFSRIAAAVPGFGGLFYDENGIANVYLTDPSRAAEFQRAGAEVRILTGQYDFRDLARWRDDLLALMSRPEVVLLDVDERRNRVRLGVDQGASAAALAAIEGALAASGAPRESVMVEAVAPILPLATLRDRVRPVPGGVQIAFNNFLCTLGFNAVRGGVQGFVTNSHCSGTQGGVQNTVFYQNTNASGNRIGIETADPNYFTGSPCPAGRRCRYSDSSFARLDSTSTDQFARIARTTSSGNQTGSITVSTTASRFVIAATASFPSAGQTLNKMGRTTGWTRGTVQSTCVNVNVSGTTITQLCQSIVGAGSGGGDSGSPVFSASTSSSNVNATLYGILWGGDTAGTIFVMSPFGQIVSELGSLTVR
jgi:hypothetical protein